MTEHNANHDGIAKIISKHLYSMGKEAEEKNLCAFCFQMTLLYTIIRTILENKTDVECANMMTHALNAAMEDEQDKRDQATMH